MDRRVPVFLVCAVVAAALIPVSDFPGEDFRWVAAATAVTYVVLALVVFLDWVARRQR